MTGYEIIKTGESASKEKGCPFYGFHLVLGIQAFVDGEGGNNCALETTSYPCTMESSGKTVDWDACPLKNSENQKVKDLSEKCRFFPKGQWPKGKGGWRGLTFGEMIANQNSL